MTGKPRRRYGKRGCIAGAVLVTVSGLIVVGIIGGLAYILDKLT